jgi:hypothetical protein
MEERRRITMSEVEDLRSTMYDTPDDYEVGDTGFHLIDSDTLVKEGESKGYRLRDFDAPEIAHTGRSKSSRGDAAADEHFRATRMLAAKYGFSDVRASEEKGYYKRKLTDLVNPETNETWSDFSIRNGFNQADRHSSEEALAQQVMGQSSRLEGHLENEEIQNIRIQLANINRSAGGGSDELKSRALNETDYAMNPEMYSGVAVRDHSRTLDGAAVDQWTTSFDTAVIGLGGMLGGAKRIFAAATESDDWEESGNFDLAMANRDIQLNPTTTIDISEVEGISDGWDYFGNMAAMSLPYMAGIAASTVGGTLVGTAVAPVVGSAAGAAAGFSLGLAGPAMFMAGDVYNNQTEKNAKVAVASGLMQATVERVALGLIGGTFKGLKLPIVGGPSAIEKALVVAGMAPKEAAKRVITASKRSLAELTGDAANFAAKQVSVRNITRDMFNKSVSSMGVEATTEMIQETLAFMGENHELENFNILQEGRFQKEFSKRIINAGVGGGVLGAGFGGISGIHEASGWSQVKHDLNSSQKLKTKADHYAEAAEGEMNGHMGHQDYLNEIGDEIKADPDSVHPDDAALSIDGHKTRMNNRTTIDKILTRATSGVANMFRGAGKGKNKFTALTLEKSETARRMYGMYIDALQRIHSGRNYEGDLHHQSTQMTNIAGNIRDYSRGYKGNKNINKAQAAMDKDFYGEWARQRIAWNETNIKNKTKVPFDYNNVPGFDAAQVSQFRALEKALDATSKDMRDRQNKAAASGDVDGKQPIKNQDLYFLKYKSMDKAHMARYKEGFVQKIVDSYGMSNKAATEMANSIINNDTKASQSDEVFQLLNNGVPTGATRNASMSLAQNPALKEFFNQSVQHNVDEAIRTAARFTTYNNFLGKDMSKLLFMRSKAIDEGLDADAADDMVAAINDIINAQSGNYMRPEEGTTQAELMKVQKNVSLFTLFAALPLSMPSSIPELAIVAKGLTVDQITGKNGLKNVGKEFASMLYKGAGFVAHRSWSGHEDTQASAGMKLLDELGFKQHEVGAATRTGAAEVSDWRRAWVDGFFKYNGLTGWTDFTRAVRAAIGNDFIQEKMEILLGSRKVLEENNEMRSARAELRNLGIDVDRTMDLYTDIGPHTEKDMQFLKEQQSHALYNWVNEAIVLPGAANRPLFYQDPRFALLTQFNGFISTFTAHHIPKMWGEYVKRGSPEMKYNAFSVMATMIMLGYASQEMKDQLKFGESSPYLDTRGKGRRAVNSSGLLGTGERVTGMIVPEYPEPESQGYASRALDRTMGEVPAFGPLGRLFKGAAAAWDGEGSEAAYNVARGSPIIAPLTQFDKFITGYDK